MCTRLYFSNLTMVLAFGDGGVTSGASQPSSVSLTGESLPVQSHADAVLAAAVVSAAATEATATAVECSFAMFEFLLTVVPDAPESLSIFEKLRRSHSQPVAGVGSALDARHRLTAFLQNWREQRGLDSTSTSAHEFSKSPNREAAKVEVGENDGYLERHSLPRTMLAKVRFANFVRLDHFIMQWPAQHHIAFFSWRRLVDHRRSAAKVLEVQDQLLQAHVNHKDECRHFLGLLTQSRQMPCAEVFFSRWQQAVNQQKMLREIRKVREKGLDAKIRHNRAIEHSLGQWARSQLAMRLRIALTSWHGIALKRQLAYASHDQQNAQEKQMVSLEKEMQKWTVRVRTVANIINRERGEMNQRYIRVAFVGWRVLVSKSNRIHRSSRGNNKGLINLMESCERDINLMHLSRAISSWRGVVQESQKNNVNISPVGRKIPQDAAASRTETLQTSGATSTHVFQSVRQEAPRRIALQQGHYARALNLQRQGVVERIRLANYSQPLSPTRSPETAQTSPVMHERVRLADSFSRPRSQTPETKRVSPGITHAGPEFSDLVSMERSTSTPQMQTSGDLQNPGTHMEMGSLMVPSQIEERWARCSSDGTSTPPWVRRARAMHPLPNNFSITSGPPFVASQIGSPQGSLGRSVGSLQPGVRTTTPLQAATQVLPVLSPRLGSSLGACSKCTSPPPCLSPPASPRIMIAAPGNAVDAEWATELSPCKRGRADCGDNFAH